MVSMTFDHMKGGFHDFHDSNHITGGFQGFHDNDHMTGGFHGFHDSDKWIYIYLSNQCLSSLLRFLTKDSIQPYLTEI